MLNKVRSRSGVAIASDFLSSDGSPLVQDDVTGLWYGYANAAVLPVGPQASVRGFGALGDGTDATAGFQRAFDYFSDLPSQAGVQGTLRIPAGAYRISSILYVPSNVRIIGEGPNFAAEIVPTSSFTGDNIFAFDGTQATGGYVFRTSLENILIDCSSFPTGRVPILLQDCYTIRLRDVYMHNGRGAALVRVTVSAGAVNDVSFSDVHLFGESTANAPIGFDIQQGSGVRLNDCDVEVCATGYKITNNPSVTIVGCYAERNLIGWDHQGGSTSSLTVMGGQWASPGASGIAATIRGDNCTVIGGRYTANGGSGLRTSDATSRPANCHVVGVSGDVTDTKNWIGDLSVIDTASWYPSTVRNYKATVADNVATDFYTVTVPFAAANFGVLEVLVNARDASGFSVWTARYRCCLTNSDGTLRSTAITEYGKAAQDHSAANYTLAITTAMNLSGTTATFRITADVGGALGAGTTSKISTEASLVQFDSAGGVYMQAA